MEARDADGYVFRTDLRLRPDPAATPPAVALASAITYYESMGQNWERAAMIKARPVAGDLALGAAFLEAIRPFVWRRGLDFAAVADIHAMKRRIDEHKGGALGRRRRSGRARAAGHNVKLGEGGIREIEFLAQTLQLVWGGRDPALRIAATLRRAAGCWPAPATSRAAPRAELAGAYRFLRQVEHRLQMVADRQMHALPERPAELERFATFLGYAAAAAFADAVLLRICPGARALRRGVRASAGTAGRRAGEPADAGFPRRRRCRQDTVRRAARARFHRTGPHRRGGARLAGRPCAGAALAAGARADGPDAAAACWPRWAASAQPDAAFARFDAFIARLPAGVQLLSLFQRNPALLDRVAAVLGAAPSLADHLARHPAALEGLLSPEDDGDPGRAACAAGCATRGCWRT